jgi:hypothetical protein
MRLARWERYAPDVEDNRDRYQAGDPAMIVELRPPSARVWREFWRAVIEDPTRDAEFKRLIAAGEDWLRRALLDDTLAELLWRPCVGKVEIPDGMIEGLDRPIRTGAALWAARDELADAGGLYTDILNAIVNRASLTAGLVVPLASASGRPRSHESDGSLDGIAASVAPRD